MSEFEPGSERPPSEHGYAPLWVVYVLEDLGMLRVDALVMPCDDAVREMVGRIKERLIADKLIEKTHA